MGANPHANGGMLLRDLRMPDFRDYAADVPSPGARGIGDTHVLGPFLRDVAKLNEEQRNFRVFGPDETLSNLSLIHIFIYCFVVSMILIFANPFWTHVIAQTAGK